MEFAIGFLAGVVAVAVVVYLLAPSQHRTENPPDGKTVLPRGWSSDYPPPRDQPGGPDWEPPQYQKPKPKTMWDRS